MTRGVRNLFSARQLLTILSAQSASTYANQVIALVIPWLVLTRPGSAPEAGAIPFALGTPWLAHPRAGSAWSAAGIAVAMGIAAVAGTLAGGLVTDRIGGRRVSMLADGLSLVTALTLSVGLSLGFFGLWFVAATQVLG